MKNSPREPAENSTESAHKNSSPQKKNYEQPKLSYVQPKLTKHGDVRKVTQQGFFGVFTP